jgi:hypothetical protein
MIHSIIVGIIIGLCTMHIAQERINGSKQLQLLSGSHYVTYWLANYLFDTFVIFTNVVSIVIAMRLVNFGINDTSHELYQIAASTNTLGFFTLILFFSSLTWSLLAYILSFHFKSSVICFVFLAMFLGFMAFLDGVLTFLHILLLNPGDVTGGTPNAASNLVWLLKNILILLFPNMVVKHASYNLKIRTNSYCIDVINYVYNCKFAINFLSSISIKV